MISLYHHDKHLKRGKIRQYNNIFRIGRIWTYIVQLCKITSNLERLSSKLNFCCFHESLKHQLAKVSVAIW